MFCPEKKNRQHFMKFACDGQLKVQSKFSVIATKREIISDSPCAKKVKENEADNIMNNFKPYALQHSKKVKSHSLCF